VYGNVKMCLCDLCVCDCVSLCVREIYGSPSECPLCERERAREKRKREKDREGADLFFLA